MNKHMMGWAALLLSLSCSDDSSSGDSPDPKDGNLDPKVATCETRLVQSCIDTSVCRGFTSSVAATAVRSTCEKLGNTITTEDCSDSYVACCVHQDGSNDYPEKICVGQSNVSLLKADCNEPGDVWCGP